MASLVRLLVAQWLEPWRLKIMKASLKGTENLVLWDVLYSLSPLRAAYSFG